MDLDATIRRMHDRLTALESKAAAPAASAGAATQLNSLASRVSVLERVVKAGMDVLEKRIAALEKAAGTPQAATPTQTTAPPAKPS